MHVAGLATREAMELTTPKAHGRPINTHVVPSRPPSEPDYEKMRQLAHPRPAAPSAPPAENAKK